MYQEYQVLQAGKTPLRSGTVLLDGKTNSRQSRPAQTARVLLLRDKTDKKVVLEKPSGCYLTA
jgi:hypothetical protein